MSRVGTLTTGAGVVTLLNFSFVPEVVLVGTTDTDLPLDGFSLTVGGRDYQNIQDQSLLQAFSKWNMEGMLGADVKVAQRITISDGFVAGQNCTMAFTNAGATTPEIYVNSQGKGTRLLEVGTYTIQASSNRPEENFKALFMDPSNLDYAMITFADGHSDKFTVPELRTMFVEMNTSDADGNLAGVLVIDNMALNDTGYGNIAQVDLYTTNGGTMTVLKVA